MARHPAANPLGGIARKPASYVGDLDELLGQVSDDVAPNREGRGEASNEPMPKSAKEEMKIEEPGDEPRSRINLLLPTDLHRQFKATAASRGVTMTSVLEAYIRSYVGE